MGKEIWLDPTEDEAKAGSSSLVLACMPALGVVTNVWQNGRMSPQEGLDVCLRSYWCTDVVELISYLVYECLSGEVFNDTFHSFSGTFRCGEYNMTFSSGNILERLSMP